MPTTNKSEPVDVDVLPPGPVNGVMTNPVRFSLGTTLQSPFFWLVIGVALGVWICKTRRI